MAEMDERFQQILAWQQMDQNKAISQILQEVSPCPGREGEVHEGRAWELGTEPCPGRHVRDPMCPVRPAQTVRKRRQGEASGGDPPVTEIQRSAPASPRAVGLHRED